MREYFPVNNKDCDSANSGSISDVIKNSQKISCNFVAFAVYIHGWKRIKQFLTNE